MSSGVRGMHQNIHTHRTSFSLWAGLRSVGGTCGGTYLSDNSLYDTWKTLLSYLLDFYQLLLYNVAS
jgi:hypothetical protein